MAGLSRNEKQLVAENNHRRVMINGQEYKVEDFWDQNKGSEQLMKDLVEAIRKQLDLEGIAGGSTSNSGKSPKPKNARRQSEPKDASPPPWLQNRGGQYEGLGDGPWNQAARQYGYDQPSFPNLGGHDEGLGYGKWDQVAGQYGYAGPGPVEFYIVVGGSRQTMFLVIILLFIILCLVIVNIGNILALKSKP
ncbi:hypothetical protein C5167_040885 [Papaver somniferum]|uniref:Uncharacterized protein n=1 Tax=Papaver somniferum TaxID=3469 RepID=A0A4Y7IGA2_PAPSO|nr:uncharacterized protein LOC113338864 [Papaver somniferum]RZC47943.1 hypothetical protein C5167_040885 [Papaver somniferum]